VHAAALVQLPPLHRAAPPHPRIVEAASALSQLGQRTAPLGARRRRQRRTRHSKVHASRARKALPRKPACCLCASPTAAAAAAAWRCLRRPGSWRKGAEGRVKQRTQAARGAGRKCGVARAHRSSVLARLLRLWRSKACGEVVSQNANHHETAPSLAQPRSTHLAAAILTGRTLRAGSERGTHQSAVAWEALQWQFRNAAVTRRRNSTHPRRRRGRRTHVLADARKRRRKHGADRGPSF